MAKEREYKTYEYESVTVTLPTTIRQGEHRKIERLTIQIAAEEFTELQSEIGSAFEELERQQRSTNQTTETAVDDGISDQELTAMLTVLTGMSRDDIDDISRDDFLALQSELSILYRRASDAERELGKVGSVPS